jgi:hypothetical protein
MQEENASRSFSMQAGETVLIPSPVGPSWSLNVSNLENRLCPSVYDADIRCFWEGEVIANFTLLDQNKDYVSSFSLSTHNPPSSMVLWSASGQTLYLHPDGYDPGQNRGDVTLFFFLSMSSFRDGRHQVR